MVKSRCLSNSPCNILTFRDTFSSVDYQGRGELAERQQKLGQFLSILTKLGDEFNAAIWLTVKCSSRERGGEEYRVSLIHTDFASELIMSHHYGSYEALVVKLFAPFSNSVFL